MLAQVAPASRFSELSEAELLALYPVIAIGGTVLFVVGLICDVYLVARIARAMRAAPAEENSLLRVETKPWGIHELAMATAAILAVLIIGSGLFYAAARALRLGESDENSFLLAGEVLLRFAMVCGFIWYFQRRQYDWRQAFGLRAAPLTGAVALGAIAYLAIFPPLTAVFVVYAKVCQVLHIKQTPQPVADMFMSTDSPVALVLLIGFAVVVAPVFEEFFFRGFAYPALKQRWGAGRALVIVSGAFAFIHFHAPSIGPLFALSIGLGLAYELTGSLLAPIVMHALFNATNVAMLLYVRSQS